MGQKFVLKIATRKEEADIRHLLATSPMPGRITVTFEREPDYFLGCGTMGPFYQVVVARHSAHGELAGVLCRAVSSRFVNGQPHSIGYLGQLRVAEKYQGKWVLLHGLDFVRQLDADGRVPYYLTAISDENRIARGILVDHPRRHMPAMRPIAHIYTLGIILHRPLPWRKKNRSILIRPGSPEQLPEIVAFLQRTGAAKQFFPHYTAQDFLDSSSSILRGFRLADLLVAYRQDRIVGTVGLWDQSAYKQTVVQAYHGPLRWARPMYNLGARLLGAQPLPAPGEHIRSAYMSLICVAENDPTLFDALLDRACSLATSLGYAHLMLGLTEQDPLLAVARNRPHIAYHSQLYIASWHDVDSICQQLDDRIPYIEIAAL